MPKLTAIRKQALDETMREAIFEAAMAVLAEHGVEGMTMDRVAVAANVAKGSLYHYLPGKQALLELVYTRIVEPIVQNLETVVASDRPAIEKLANHLGTLLEHVSQNLQVFRLLFRDNTAQGLLHDLHRRSHEDACQRMTEVFRQGIAEGAFRPEDPRLLTSMFMGLCHGAFDAEPELDVADKRQEVQRLILGVFLKGVATDASRRGGEPKP